jgi:hypothetical protein
MAELLVRDRDDTIGITFEDILKYHGRGYVGGVAHGFKVLQRALPVISPDGPPDRYGITIESAFPGPGARDAFEFVARAVTHGERYKVDVAMGPDDVIEAARGRYFFRLGYDGRTVELGLMPGIVTDEFIAFGRKGAANLSKAELERVEWLKRDMADRIMALSSDEVYAIRK